MSGIVLYEDEIEFASEGPFPAKVILSREQAREVSVKIGTLGAGKEIPIHSHNDANQLEYYLEGEALLYVEGVGERKIPPGTFMYAPRGVKHGIRNVTKQLKIYAVLVPVSF